MSFPFVWNDDEAAGEELNQLLAKLPPLFPSENIIASTEDWEVLLEGTSSPDCVAAFSALDLSVPPPPPVKAPMPIAPAVLLPAAENISMERRLKRANDAPPRAVTKKTYQAVASDLRGMNWLNELMKRSHDHCRLLESPLKVALRAQNFAQKQKNGSLPTPSSSPSLTPITSDDFLDALRKYSDAFLTPNQLDMRDRVLESCESDQTFFSILLASIRNLSAENAAAEIESVKSARRNLRKFIKQPSAVASITTPSTLVTSSELVSARPLPDVKTIAPLGHLPPFASTVQTEVSPRSFISAENVFKVEVS